MNQHRRRGVLRLLWIVTGACCFLWMGVEDRRLTLVMLLAVLIAVSTAFSLQVRRENRDAPSERRRFLRRLCVGFIAGAAVSPLAVLLMFIKVGLHGHPLPEFSPADVARVLERAPVWIGVGTLVGLAAGLIHFTEIPRRSR